MMTGHDSGDDNDDALLTYINIYYQYALFSALPNKTYIIAFDSSAVKKDIKYLYLKKKQ